MATGESNFFASARSVSGADSSAQGYSLHVAFGGSHDSRFAICEPPMPLDRRKAFGKSFAVHREHLSYFLLVSAIQESRREQSPHSVVDPRYDKAGVVDAVYRTQVVAQWRLKPLPIAVEHQRFIDHETEQEAVGRLVNEALDQ